MRMSVRGVEGGFRGVRGDLMVVHREGGVFFWKYFDSGVRFCVGIVLGEVGRTYIV